MDGLEISNSYSLLKASQNKFTNWLKSTSDACANLNKSGKSKPKHKKPAPCSKVRFDELQRLASTVAKVLRPEDIPNSIGNTLCHAIDQRRKCFEFFGQQFDEHGYVKEFSRENEHHLKILEGVQKTLNLQSRPTPLFVALNSDLSLKVRIDNEEAQINDIYEIEDLNLNGHITETQESGRREKESKPRCKRLIDLTLDPDYVCSTTKYEVESEVGDRELMIFCFLQDMNKIREYLQERWCDYQDGILGLTSVSIITNTSFDLFRKAEGALQLQLRQGSVGEHYEKVMRANFQFNPFAERQIFFGCLDLKHISYRGWDESKDWYRRADFTFLPVFQQLKAFLSQFPRGKTATMSFLHQEYKTKAMYGQTPDEKLCRNVIVLHQFIAEMSLHVLAKERGVEFPAEDELQRGIVEMLESRKIPIWLIFASQVFLDIRYILEADVDRAHHELIATGVRIRRGLNYLKEIAADVVDCGGAQDDYAEDYAHLAFEVQEWCENDFIGSSIRNKHHDDGVGTQSGITAEPFFFLKRNPIYCGLLAFRFNLKMQDIGMMVTNQTHYAVTAAHLYNVPLQLYNFAMRNSKDDYDGDAAGYWQDMETLIEIHKGIHIFGGERPLKMDASRKSWEEVRGVMDGSHEIWFQSKKHRSKGHLISVAFTPMAHVSVIFKNRYCKQLDDKDNALKAELSTLEKMLEKLCMDTSTDYLDLEDRHLITDMNRYAIEGKYSDRFSYVQHQYQRTHTLTQLQLLDLLCQNVHAERAQHAFDYLALHEKCYQALLEVRDEFQDEYEKNHATLSLPPPTTGRDEMLNVATFVLNFLIQLPYDKVNAAMTRLAWALGRGYDMHDSIHDSMQNMLQAGYLYGPNLVRVSKIDLLRQLSDRIDEIERSEM